MSLSGSDKVIHLSEVQVFAVVNGVETNVALASSGATATQSSTYPNQVNFTASNAINGQHLGLTSDITHTNFENDPWWEVELTDSYDVTQIVIWNRKDCCSERLSGAVLSLLDVNRNVLEEYVLGDTTNQKNFVFTLTDESPTSSPSASPTSVSSPTDHSTQDSLTDAIFWPDISFLLLCRSLNPIEMKAAHIIAKHIP